MARSALWRHARISRGIVAGTVVTSTLVAAAIDLWALPHVPASWPYALPSLLAGTRFRPLVVVGVAAVSTLLYVAVSIKDPEPRPLAVFFGAGLVLVHVLAVLLTRLRIDAERLRTSAEAALRERETFVATAAHELRSPLAVLSGNVFRVQTELDALGVIKTSSAVAVPAGMLAQREVALSDLRPARDALDVVERQVDRLVSLATRLLDAAQAQRDALALSLAPADLASLVRDVVAAWDRGGRVALTAPESLPAVVDELRIEQVLRNLLDNAAKYGGHDRPVEVTLTQHGMGGHAVELTVRDHGPGIAPAQRGRVFDQFYRARDASQSGGLGLGLYVCREIVRRHGGQITVGAPPGGGALFVVSLPVSPVSPS